MSDLEWKVWAIAALWLVTLTVRVGLKEVRGRTDGMTNFRMWWAQANAPMTRPQRLCGFHAGLENRPGLSAVVDGKRCEMCKLEHVAMVENDTPDDAA